MQRALALARKGEGRVEPNPMVGCVIARRGRVIGEGYHRRFGGPHAEVEALTSCVEEPRGATVYVSLEPCRHHGKTPPCTEALIEARVGRVVAAVADPSPLSGGGIRELRKAGIAVEVGVGETEAAEVLAPFLTRVALGRPYVIAKWAQSLDGKLATATGDSKWISGEASRRQVHRLRARMDAILIGSGTALADDPMLTARDVPVRRRAVRVVLDGRLRLSERSQLVVTASTVPTMVFTSKAKVGLSKAGRLARRGVEVAACRTHRGRPVVADCLRRLSRRAVTNLLVEGGPTILTSFLKAGLVDEAWAFVSPKLIGGSDGPGVLAGKGVARVADALIPRTVVTRRWEADTLFRMRLTEVPRS
jgi:diaminohydroxyphosphoribosylaminopyrimidine deaminase/5-amino-6-(5-phosphoribosylamino)uracil reductase